MALDLSEYSRLSRVKTGQKIQRVMAACFPGGQCPLFGVMTIFPFIRRINALIIGPAICTYNTRLALGLRSLTSMPLKDNLILLCLQQQDMVFGIDTKVKEAIIEIDKKYSPDALFIVSTCVLEIIGEDLDALVQEIKDKVNAKLVVIHTDHFSGTDLSLGIERALTALTEIMEPVSTEENTVNLIGYYHTNSQNTELAELLMAKGVRVHQAIPSIDSLDKLSSAPAAKINLVLEPRALALAQKMRGTFGTEYLYCPRPFALGEVENWYRQIALSLDIDLSKEIALLKSQAEMEITGLKDKLTGKSFGLRGVSDRPFAVARFLVDLGMEPVFIHVSEIMETDEKDVQAILAAGFDPLLINGENSVEIDRLLAELQPDYFIPINYRDLQPAARMGILVKSIESASMKLGFSCSLEVSRLLANANTDFKFLHYREQIIQKAGVR